MKKSAASVLFLVIFLATGAVSAAGAKMTVFASIVPQRYFIEKIAKDRVQVHVMVEPGASPATYEPKPRQMVQLSEASAYFAVGVPFEAVWLDKIAASNPSMRIVHTDRGIEKVPMAIHDHGQAPRQGHAHAGFDGIFDPHIWTSPPLVMIQARNILTALSQIDPSHRALYAENYAAFIAALVDLDVELMNIFSRKGRRDRFMVFHPSWGYFADAYGLTQIPIEIEGKAPKPAQLVKLITQARKQDVGVIFVQPQFSTQSAEFVAREIGAKVVFADPLAQDWADSIRRQAQAFRSAME